MKKIQIPIDEKLFKDVEDARKLFDLEFSQVIEEALRLWLLKRDSKRFGDEWVSALKKNPEKTGGIDDLIEAQAWSEL